MSRRMIKKIIFGLILLLFLYSLVLVSGPAVKRIQTLSDITVEPYKYIREELNAIKKNLKDLNLKYAVKSFPHITELPSSIKKRVLITGGAGFVGSHLASRLLIEGHEVTVIDNFFTGSRANIEMWIGHKNFELIHHDIINPIYIEVDEIYHLASPASPPNYMRNPIKTIKTNTLGTINMLGLAKRTNSKFLLASTSEVYGDPKEHPQSESYWGNVNPIGPRACYDEGKRIAETLTYAYHRKERVQVRVARIFNTYGPRMQINDGRVVSNFILQALQGKPITIYGQGGQTRSFQYVDDLVEGLIRLMHSNYSQPVNLGNPEEHTIKDFAEIIKKLVGSDSEIMERDAAEDDPQRRQPNIALAKQVLNNWYPKVALQDGLRKTVDYFRQVLSKSSQTVVDYNSEKKANLKDHDSDKIDNY